ncbi:putative Zinc knuckle family protein [Hibiscus syriacus]|uniref:Zinc knuckle family protein n=1 Tax=Hibiscus syriacus TaxID=106335 RepID=A0A6A3BAX4_HIBSY|nr:putative Zinc knuckle family protein [Hibiscus syriacus]
MGYQIKREINSNKLNSSERRKRAKTSLSTARTNNLSLMKGETNAMSNPKIMEKYKLSTELEWVDQTPECPVFHPSMEEFKDPLAFLQTISQQASKYGICKIVSPWKASVPASDVLMKEQRGFEFKAYVQHLRLHQWNLNDMPNFLITESTYNYSSFEKMANKAFAKRFPDQSTGLSPVYLEKQFWLEMARGTATVEYGVNIDGSAFSSDPNDQLGQSNGNLKTFQQLPNCSLRLLDYQIPGITFPMLYIGMLFSTFAWHVEDHYLYSINYHHSGAPKTWYGVPGHAASGFETVVRDYIYDPDILSHICEDGASAVLAEKTTMFPPNILLQHNVPVYKAVQKPGEYVITFPRAYHAGFSQGCNCGEAVNFAIGEWFPWGAVAGQVYAHLCKMAILPYEELLCKEAIILSESSNHRCLDHPAFVEPSSQSSVRRSFVRHIESLNTALRHLHDSMPRITYSSVSQGTIICQLCKRDCYLTFLECDKCFHHTCVFHAVDSLRCSCSGKLIVYIDEGIWKAVDAYRVFEESSERGIEQELCLSIRERAYHETILSCSSFANGNSTIFRRQCT